MFRQLSIASGILVLLLQCWPSFSDSFAFGTLRKSSSERHVAKCDEQIAADDSKQDSRESEEEPKENKVKGSEFDFDLLLRFVVPDESNASDKSPLRLKARITRTRHKGPLMLRGFVLLPIQPEKTEENGKEKGNDDPDTDDEKNREYLKLPFGSMDLVGPIDIRKSLFLFPYEDAEAVRKKIKPGDAIWIGIEAVSLESKQDEPKKLDVDVKVQEVLSW